jgi:hypothetical protein
LTLLAETLICAKQAEQDSARREKVEDAAVVVAIIGGETAPIIAAILLPAATALDSPERSSSRTRRYRSAVVDERAKMRRASVKEGKLGKLFCVVKTFFVFPPHNFDKRKSNRVAKEHRASTAFSFRFYNACAAA